MTRQLDAAIATFAGAMRHELRCNGRKGDPRRLDALEHVSELLYHAAKLYVAVRFGHREAALEYAADCGNHAWMAADAAGVLDVALLTENGEGGDRDDDGYTATAWSAGYDDLKALAHTDFARRLANLADELGAPATAHALGKHTPAEASR